MEGFTDADRLRERLRAALRAALKTRDPIATAALRSAVSAINNAEAVDRPHAPGPRLGVGAADVRRRELSANDIVEIIRDEVTDRDSAAADYERRGRTKEATRLRAEAATLSSLLDGQPEKP
jgi:uncharacterized protein YqeY